MTHNTFNPHDYFDENYVREWARDANLKRPFRAEFFAAFVAELNNLSPAHVLDVGSGPGFLAEQILAHTGVATYHLFDFAPLMLDLSRERLARFGDRACFHQGSFLEPAWWQALPAPFDAVVSMQAVHELRDAARIPQLYGELRALLAPGGLALVADLVNTADRMEDHLLTAAEQQQALHDAGFQGVRQVQAVADVAMFAATR